MKIVNMFAILDKLTKELFLDRLTMVSAAAYMFSISLELNHLELKVVATIFLTYSATNNRSILTSKNKKISKKFDK